MSDIVVRGQTFSSIEDLRDRLAAAARNWEVSNPAQWSPAENWTGTNDQERLWVQQAAALLAKSASEPNEFELADHLGAGPNPSYYEALLDRLEGNPPVQDLSVRSALLQRITWVTVGKRPGLRLRARALLSAAGREDLMLRLLGMDDPEGDVLDILERASGRMAIEPLDAGAAAWGIARGAPENLIRAARALANQAPPVCRQFLERARIANPAWVAANEAALLQALGLD